ncbi:10905_t:CDS:2 [Acaulospora morrowiae]|uniref:10905_t:CDS:1 n=1 Tax=Acaulospora morrowiae TaxID=94023 RepID=A0A9N8ZC73_9GLOM|nr:10905_t:CDS:2 [Acaulospora morrowiae]
MTATLKAVRSDTSRKMILSIYRQLLREVQKQFTPYNKNPYWKLELIKEFRQNRDASNKELLEKLDQDATDLLSFLRSNRRYGELLTQLDPMHGLTEQQRVEKTANRVGLKVPAGNT